MYSVSIFTCVFMLSNLTRNSRLSYISFLTYQIFRATYLDTDTIPRCIHHVRFRNIASTRKCCYASLMRATCEFYALPLSKRLWLNYTEPTKSCRKPNEWQPGINNEMRTWRQRLMEICRFWFQKMSDCLSQWRQHLHVFKIIYSSCDMTEVERDLTQSKWKLDKCHCNPSTSSSIVVY